MAVSQRDSPFLRLPHNRAGSILILIDLNRVWILIATLYSAKVLRDEGITVYIGVRSSLEADRSACTDQTNSKKNFAFFSQMITKSSGQARGC
jgi:hypothetical protein